MQSEGVFRLRVAEALDHIENSGFRDLGLIELNKIIHESVSESNLNIFLSILFSKRNRNIFRRLVPCLTSLHTRISNELLSKHACRFLVDCLVDECNHDVVKTTWTDLIVKKVLNYRSVFPYFTTVARVAHTSQRGLGNVLIESTRLAIREKNLEDMEALSLELARLYGASQLGVTTDALFESISVLMKVIPARFAKIDLDLVADCCRFLLRRSKVKLTRRLAQACCELLLSIRENTSSDSHESTPEVLLALSRDNLHLFALTRSNPKLRDAIKAAQEAWQTRIPVFAIRQSLESPKHADEGNTQSPHHISSNFTVAPTTVRMSDSPFKRSEAYVECMQTPEDNSSEIFTLVKSDYTEITISAPVAVSDEIIDIRAHFHRSVDLLARLVNVQESLNEILRLGDLPGFCDCVDSEDVLALHELLLSLDGFEPTAEHLLYKFFQET